MFGISHPKHVYMFKNVISWLLENGAEILVLSIKKDVSEALLKNLNIPFVHIGDHKKSLFYKSVFYPLFLSQTLKYSLRFNPHIFVGQALPNCVHSSVILGKPYLLFEDTEAAKLIHYLTLPFVDTVITPSCYQGEIGKQHVCFNGYYELSYLHPNYFKPDDSVLKYEGLSKGEKYIILRFVSWEATHDIGQKGLSFKNKSMLIKELEKYGKVLITSEAKLPQAFERYKISIPPEKIHHLLYYATMYIGEGGTMASEAAVLGTPSIYINSIKLGYLMDQEKEYGLTYNFKNIETALPVIKKLLDSPNLKDDWMNKRAKMLDEKIDVTSWMVDFIRGFV